MGRFVRIGLALVVTGVLPQTALTAETLWANNQPRVQLIAPALSGATQNLVPDTLNEYFSSAFGWKIPVADRLSASALNLVVGNE